MTFRTSRLSRRRQTGAALALLYFWVFAALGLTHTHGGLAGAAWRPMARLVAAAGTGTDIASVAASSDDDSTCPVCTAVHAATAALARPPAVVAVLAPTRRLVIAERSYIPSLLSDTSRSRAPPTSQD